MSAANSPFHGDPQRQPCANGMDNRALVIAAVVVVVLIAIYYAMASEQVAHKTAPRWRSSRHLPTVKATVVKDKFHNYTWFGEEEPTRPWTPYTGTVAYGTWGTAPWAVAAEMEPVQSSPAWQMASWRTPTDSPFDAIL